MKLVKMKLVNKTLTLNRAHKIIARINEELVNTELAIRALSSSSHTPGSISPSEIFTIIETNREKLFALVEKFEDGVRMVEIIREKIAINNASLGISARLAEIESENRMLRFIRTYIQDGSDIPSLGIPLSGYTAKYNQVQELKVSANGTQNTNMLSFTPVQVSLMSDEFISAMVERKSVAISHIRKLTDEIADLNRNTMAISLDEDFAKVLGL